MSFTLICPQERFSSDQLNRLVQRVRAGLHAAGCREGDTMAVMLRNGPEYVAAVLACRESGLFTVSLNWHFKAAEAAWVLNDSGAKLLLVGEEFVDQVREGLPPALAVVTTGQAWASFGRDAPPAPASSGISHGNVIYTSGTSGRPKGIRRSAPPRERRAEMEAALQAVNGVVYGGSAESRALLSAPLYHSAAMLYFLHFYRLGATLVLEPGFQAERTLELVAKHRITHAYLVPTMYKRLLELPSAIQNRYELGSLQQVASTGSPCAPELKRAMINWLGPLVSEAYGSSEMGYMTFIDSRQWQQRPGSVGRAVGDAQIRILDEHGRAVPAGQSGLIYVRQPAMADFSYIGQGDARRAMERDGFLALGDVGYLDADGYLFICDRQSDMVISGGVNIYPAEIEHVLQGMPGVKDCAVFGIPDEEFGETLAAAIAPMADAALDEGAVKAWLRERISNYKVPRVVDFHATLPREDSGKIFKRRLREPYWRDQKRAI